ncbi:MAG: hypothetical protein MJE66_11920 [Proteobacteria bacterium]|nr:hypothetical protein [Pseudomonadota bacterium]
MTDGRALSWGVPHSLGPVLLGLYTLAALYVAGAGSAESAAESLRGQVLAARPWLPAVLVAAGWLAWLSGRALAPYLWLSAIGWLFLGAAEAVVPGLGAGFALWLGVLATSYACFVYLLLCESLRALPAPLRGPRLAWHPDASWRAWSFGRPPRAALGRALEPRPVRRSS